MQGLLLWHGLVVVGLNWLHSGGSLQEGVGPLEAVPVASRKQL